jgi:hypothetical protein
MKSLSHPGENSETFALATCNNEGDVDPSSTSDVQIIRHPASIRVILDPNGEDHDILIEQQDDHWGVYVHPNGGDPICVVRLYEKHTVVENDIGDQLITTEG